MELEARRAAGRVHAARRHRGRRVEHLGRDQGPRRPRDRVGRRPATPPTTRPITRRRWSAPRRAGQGGAQPGRRRSGAGRRGEGVHARILPAAHGARADGAAGGARRRVRRQVRGLGMPAEPRRGPRRHRRVPRHEGRGRDRACHAARRRLRPQVEVRLRHRGGLSVERGRRRRSACMDPRRRHPAQLLPHHLGGADRHRPRRRRQAGGVAAPERAPSFLSTFAPDEA